MIKRLTILTIICQLLFTHCAYYHYGSDAVYNEQIEDFAVYESLFEKYKIFVVHRGDEAWRVENLRMEEEEDVISANIVEYSVVQKGYAEKAELKGGGLIKRDKGDRKEVKQIHIFLDSIQLDENNNLSFSLEDIDRIGLMKNTPVLNASIVTGIVLLPFVAIAVYLYFAW